MTVMTVPTYGTTVATYRTVDVDGLDVFYREAGNADAPTTRKG